MHQNRPVLRLLTGPLIVEGLLLFLHFKEHYSYLPILAAILSLLFVILVLRSPTLAELSKLQIQEIAFSLALLAFVFWTIAALRGERHTLQVTDQPLTIDQYFEKLRDNEAALTAFFAQMPKGGDLHNHLTGSIYAESYLEQAIEQKMYINPATLKIAPQKISNAYQRIDLLSQSKDFGDLKQRLFQDWSTKDFFDRFRASDKHFFDAFAKFPKVTAHRSFLELKERAKSEHVGYLEVMIGGPPVPKDLNTYASYNPALRKAAATKNIPEIDSLLEVLFERAKSEAASSVSTFTDYLNKAHDSIDDPEFTMRYLAAVKREAQPVEVFLGLQTAFEASATDSLIGGLNIVSREDGELAMQDYNLHMLMFRFLHRHYPSIPYSLHAGELTLGLVRPEDLTWHIREAVYTAGARRIGHGVDLPYEAGCDSLLDYMRLHQIAVEINLASNQFILKVKDDSHPIMLYAEHRVPIVICTDDAGILRTNLTAQFVMLAKRYRQLRYNDIRKFIQNSIAYSFIRDPGVKQRLDSQLNQQLSQFEIQILKTAQPSN